MATTQRPPLVGTKTRGEDGVTTLEHPDAQLQLDLDGSHHDATTAFKEWLLAQPLPDWLSASLEDGDE